MLKHPEYRFCKIAAFLLCFAIMFCLGACKNTGSANTAATKLTAAQQTTASEMGTGDLYVYFSSSDSLNPYDAASDGNQQIASLMFDSLVRLDANLNPELMIASSVDIDGKTVKITLKDVNFSDGTSVSADDVVYSLSQAKKAKNKVYTAQLNVISDYYASSSNVVTLSLKKNDPLIANVLDFPIIKQGSTGRKNDDDKDLPPIGCGRYVYSDNSGTYTLTGNKNYYGKVPQNKITLDNTPDNEALQYSIKAGEVDIYYSGVMTGNLLSMSGKNTMVKQPNIVFLGLNQQGLLVDKNLRCAVSAAVDRKDVCKTAYYNYSEPAVSIYNSGMNILKDTNAAFYASTDTDSVKSYLKNAGYANQDSDGYYISRSKSRLTLSLLYNKANAYQKNAAELIQKQLKNCGISINLDGKSYNDYVNSVLNRNYDIYLGEIKLSKDFDYSALISGEVVSGKTQKKTTTTKATTAATEKKTTAAYSTDEDGDRIYSDETTKKTTAALTTVDKAKLNENMQNLYNKYINGSLSLEKFLQKFKTEMPFVPLAFRYGVVSYNANISPAAVATVSDAYYNIQYLSIKK